MELAEISDIFMKDKKGYVTLCVTFKKEGKIMLRSSSGIQKWFSLIKVKITELFVSLGTRHSFSVSRAWPGATRGPTGSRAPRTSGQGSTTAPGRGPVTSTMWTPGFLTDSSLVS